MDHFAKQQRGDKKRRFQTLVVSRFEGDARVDHGSDRKRAKREITVTVKTQRFKARHWTGHKASFL